MTTTHIPNGWRRCPTCRTGLAPRPLVQCRNCYRITASYRRPDPRAQMAQADDEWGAAARALTPVKDDR